MKKYLAIFLLAVGFYCWAQFPEDPNRVLPNPLTINIEPGPFALPPRTTEPSTCLVGWTYWNLTLNQSRTCTAPNTWSPTGGGSNGAIIAPAGAIAGTSLAPTLRDFVSVKDYGAKGDTIRVTNGTCDGTTTAISTGSPGPFTSTAVDAGKTIGLTGCGAAGVALASTIVTVTDSQHAVIGTVTSTAVAGTSTFSFGTDDTAAFVSALADAHNKFGRVHVPASPVTVGANVFHGAYMISQITVGEATILWGDGPDYWPTQDGSVLYQKPGTDNNLIIFSPTTGFVHQAQIRDLALYSAVPSQATGGGTTSIGINMAAATMGENTIFKNLLLSAFPVDGLRVGGCVPGSIDEIHSFANGWKSGTGYGVNILVAGAQGNQICSVSHISGDDNQTALLRMGNGSGAGTGVSYVAVGIKGQKITAGKQNDLIVVDNMNGTPVTIIGAAATNSSGETADAAIKITTSAARLHWDAVDKDSHYNFLVNDAFASVTFASEPSGAWYNTTNGFGNYNVNVLALNGNNVGMSFMGFCVGAAGASATDALAPYNTTGLGCNVTGVNEARPPRAGIASNLACTSSANGTASATCTLFVGGSASALTCSLNGVSQCVDTTHTVALASNSVFSLRLVAGGSETAANIRATFLFQ